MHRSAGDGGCLPPSACHILKRPPNAYRWRRPVFPRHRSSHFQLLFSRIGRYALRFGVPGTSMRHLIAILLLAFSAATASAEDLTAPVPGYGVTYFDLLKL